MKYQVENGKIKIIFPAKNDRKFRFKVRKSPTEFGESFATRQREFNKNVYLEWQISYSTTESGETGLNEFSFEGSNGKKNYPHELAELTYEAIKIGLVSQKELQSLLDEIKSYEELIDRRQIEVDKDEKIEINHLSFKETAIKLPTLFMTDTTDNTQIEVSIQKQQYASGVQPMIYFAIPFRAFANYEEIEGRSSEVGDTLIYEIDDSNVNVLLNIFRVFGMSSEDHQHDIVRIIKVLLQSVDE